MKRMFTGIIAASALLVPAAASAYHTGSSDSASATAKSNASIAKSGQFEGSLALNACSAAHPFTVSAPGHVTVLVAGTNVAGELYAQVIGRDGTLGATDGSFNANAAGTYAARVCFIGSGLDNNTAVQYVGMVING